MYNQKIWVNGELVTDTKLNHMEAFVDGRTVEIHVNAVADYEVTS